MKAALVQPSKSSSAGQALRWPRRAAASRQLRKSKHGYPGCSAVQSFESQHHIATEKILRRQVARYLCGTAGAGLERVGCGAQCAPETMERPRRELAAIVTRHHREARRSTENYAERPSRNQITGKTVGNEKNEAIHRELQVCPRVQWTPPTVSWWTHTQSPQAAGFLRSAVVSSTVERVHASQVTPDCQDRHLKRKHNARFSGVWHLASPRSDAICSR
jgi:hypothetical protein